MAKNTNYTSAAADFIATMIKDHPELKEKRTRLLNTWSNKNQDEVTEENNLKITDLQHDSYVYFTYKKTC